MQLWRHPRLLKDVPDRTLGKRVQLEADGVKKQAVFLDEPADFVQGAEDHFPRYRARWWPPVPMRDPPVRVAFDCSREPLQGIQVILDSRPVDVGRRLRGRRRQLRIGYQLGEHGPWRFSQRELDRIRESARRRRA